MSTAESPSEDRVAALAAAAEEGPAPDSAAAAEGTAADAAPPARRQRVRKIDFTRPSKFTTDHQRRLERAHTSFSRSVSSRMSAELRAPIAMELIDTVQLTWGNALEEVPAGSLSGIVQIAPHDTRILFTAELPLLLGLLERLLGGQTGELPPERSLTDVDRALIGRLMQTLLDELSISFNDLGELSFKLVDLETERTPAQLAPLSEPTLAMTFEFRLAQNSSTMVLLLPHRSIEPVLKTHGAAEHDAEVAADAAAAVMDAMGEVSVLLRAEVGSVDMSLADVLALKPGDVLRLDGAAEEGAVTLYADAVALHRAKLGRNGRRRAVGVIGPVEEDT